MRILFPFMHPGTTPGFGQGSGQGLPDLKRFDPGYEDQPGPDAFRPQGLPLEPAAARRLVADAVGYGQQFKTPGEMAWHGLQADGTRPETERTIKAELLARLTGAGQDQADPALAQAQFVLLLAWKREADLLEQADLEARLAKGRERFDQGLGVADGDKAEDDPDQKAISLATIGLGDLLDGDESSLSWKPLLAAMARFLPRDAALVCTHPDILAAWREAGLKLSPAQGEDLPEGALQGKAPLGLLVGRSLAGSLSGELSGREVTVIALTA